MKNKTYHPIQIVEFILKIGVVISFLYWAHDIYLSILSYDEVYSAPWYIELTLMTKLSLIIYLTILLIFIITRKVRINKGLPQFKLRYLFKMKKHPYVYFMIIVVGILTVLASMIVIAQPIILYHPNHSSYAYDKLMALDQYETFEIVDENNELTYQGFGKIDEDQVLPTIIYFAGNGESSAQTFYYMYMEHIFDHFEGYQFIMIDYPGYGLSEGIPRDHSMQEMSKAVYEFVYQLDYVDQEEIYIYGYSIGTGVATYIASTYDVKGLILIAPYSSIKDLFNTYVPIFHGILSGLIVEEFDSLSNALGVDVKPLIIASRSDKTIPFEISEKLSLAFDDVYEFYVVDQTAHNEFLDKEDVLLKIVEYLEQD